MSLLGWGAPVEELLEDGYECVCDRCGAVISTEPVKEGNPVHHWAVIPIKHNPALGSPAYVTNWDADLCSACAMRAIGQEDHLVDRMLEEWRKTSD